MGIDLERRGAVAIVTVNQPDKMNSLNSERAEALLETLLKIGKDRSVRAVILTGAGDRAFIAGADIKEMAGFDRDDGTVFARLGHAVARAIETIPQPVIAAVNGFALGGGCELSLACDIRLASTKAVFAQPEVGLGIPPGWGGTQRLPRVVGPGIAAEMILTGRRVHAQEALRISLVNAVYEPGELLDEALTMAAQIAKNSPSAVTASKRLMSLAFAGHPVAGLSSEAHAFAHQFGGPDQREGMTAFVEKRAAEFGDLVEPFEKITS